MLYIYEAKSGENQYSNKSFRQLFIQAIATVLSTKILDMYTQKLFSLKMIFLVALVIIGSRKLIPSYIFTFIFIFYMCLIVIILSRGDGVGGS